MIEMGESTNPYGEALDKERHEEMQAEEPAAAEANVRHLKEPGNTIACGVQPHGIEATFDRSAVSCDACKKAVEARTQR